MLVKSRKNRNRKPLVMSVAVLAIFALVAAACNHNNDSTGATVTTTETTVTTTETTAATLKNVPGFNGTTIKLGFLTDLSGGLSIVGGPIRDGAQVYWDYVNEELGGIAGKYKVELVIEDTEDKPAIAVQNYQKIKNDVVLFAEILSTPPTAAVLEQLKIDNIVGVPGSLAGRWVREQLLLPSGAPYEYELINIVDWYHTTKGNENDVYCSVHVDDEYGNSAIQGLDHIVQKLGISLSGGSAGKRRVTINRGDTNFTAQIGDLKSAGCTVVVAATVPVEQNGMLGEALTQKFEPVWLGALPTYLNLFGKAFASTRYKNFYYAQDYPTLSDTSLPGTAKFLAREEKYNKEDFSTFALTGYAQSIPVHQLLEKAVELNDLSREGIIAASKLLGEVDSEGLAASNFVYGEAADRIPPRASRIMKPSAQATPDYIEMEAEYQSKHIDSFILPTG